MNFDVFISYAHNDNLAQEGKDGWIDGFHKALNIYLSSKLGRQVKIWRDHTNLRGNDLLDEAIADDIKRSRIFIPILSPSFLNSTYCLQELEIFSNQQHITEGNKTRIFPVVKGIINAPPAQISANLRKFQFVERDDYGNLTREIDPELGEDVRYKFNQKVNDLAREIAEFIDKTSAQVIDPPAEEPTEDVPIIYLAEPSPDLFDKYLEIKRDLEERKKQGLLKFEFLPDNLPEDLSDIADKPDGIEDYRQNVREDVRRSRLTVHLIGKKHNGFPPNSDRSYLHSAVEVAAERDNEPNFNRLVWIPKNLYTEEEMSQKGNERHKEFIRNIRQSGVNGDGLMQDSFEEFKSRIIEVLENKKTPEPSSPEDTPWVYVLCDKSDLDAVGKLEDLLQDNECAIFSTRDYLKPSDGGNGGEANALEHHNDYLSKCDAVMIYWQKAPLTWVRTNAFDLQRIKAIRKGRDFRFQVVLIDGDPQDADKARFRTPPPADLHKMNYSEVSEFLSENK